MILQLIRIIVGDTGFDPGTLEVSVHYQRANTSPKKCSYFSKFPEQEKSTKNTHFRFFSALEACLAVLLVILCILFIFFYVMYYVYLSCYGVEPENYTIVYIWWHKELRISASYTSLLMFRVSWWLFSLYCIIVFYCIFKRTGTRDLLDDTK